MAVIFIGGLEPAYDYSLVQKYFDTGAIATISFEGQEKYLIIPRYPDDIYIYSMNFTDSGMESEYYTTARGEFYILGNASEVAPNFLISTTHDGVNYEFSPYLSGRDGSVIVPEYVTWIH